jgi:hypothetical protein
MLKSQKARRYVVAVVKQESAGCWQCFWSARFKHAMGLMDESRPERIADKDCSRAETCAVQCSAVAVSAQGVRRRRRRRRR